jgi:Xaa-Pro aminopeptidase
LVIDLVLIFRGGFGCYCTLTCFVGAPAAEYSAAFEALLNAQQSSVAFVSDERTCESVDGAGRPLRRWRRY